MLILPQTHHPTISYSSPSKFSEMASSSWRCTRSTLVGPHAPQKHQPFFHFFCKSSSTGDSSSPPFSTTSYRRRWYNPLKLRQYDRPSPEIIRNWVEADQPLASHERFTVISYNILGDRNAAKHRDLYPNVSSVYMKWDYRKRAICEELIGCNPDIICLQEVDRYFDLLKIIEKAGYSGSYKRRTGDYVDGCAMFWKADRFRVLEQESIEFKGLGLRDNVAQLSAFEMYKAESRRLLVGNTHVLYNPSRGDVKLGQIRLLLSRAQTLAEKWGNIPVIMVGDFNCTPESEIYNFLCSSKLNIMLYDRRELSGQRNCHPSQVLGVKKETKSPLFFMDRFFKNRWTNDEIKVATGNSECHWAMHPFNLKSSYATIKSSTRTRDFKDEPLATSYHAKFLGTVDYLWYSDGIVPTRVLDTLPLEVLKGTGGLPCKKLGSDHLALVSEFAFTPGIKEGDAKTTTTISSGD